jgi:dihydrofolate reductase
MLLGRKTYEIFAASRPNQVGPVADPFNNAIKYVVSDKTAFPPILE